MPLDKFRRRDLRGVAGGLVATVGLILACIAATDGQALAGMRWEAGGHRPSAVDAGGQRLVAAAPVVSELTR